MQHKLNLVISEVVVVIIAFIIARYVARVIFKAIALLIAIARAIVRAIVRAPLGQKQALAGKEQEQGQEHPLLHQVMHLQRYKSMDK